MGYNYGSNAYQYEEQLREEVYQERFEQRQAISQRTKNRQKTLKTASKLLVLGMAASFMISKFVAVDDTQTQIEKLNKELAAAQTYTSEKNFELEQKVSLTKIEDEAMTRLGMQRPDKTQIIYVDIKKNDFTEVTAKEVEGTRNKVGNALKNAKQTIVNIFTLR